jgi:hypothetical protein
MSIFGGRFNIIDYKDEEGIKEQIKKTTSLRLYEDLQ